MVKRRLNIIERRNSGILRKYRAPGVFSGDKIRTKNPVSFKISYLKIPVLIAVVIFVVYYLFFSPAFRVKDIIVEGTNLLSPADILKYIPADQNVLIFNSGRTRNELLATYPEIRNVDLFRGIPNAIKVVVTEKETLVVWQSGETKYLLSPQGEVARVVQGDEGSNLPLIIDKQAIKVSPGDNIVSPSFIAFATNIWNNFYDTVNIKPTHFEVEETTFDLNLYTDAGFYVKFNTLRSSKKQLDNLKSVLVSKRSDIHEYVDIRVDGWAYYK